MHRQEHLSLLVNFKPSRVLSLWNLQCDFVEVLAWNAWKVAQEMELKERYRQEILRKCLESSNIYSTNMGVSKNRGTPKWMLYDGKPY